MKIGIGALLMETKPGPRNHGISRMIFSVVEQFALTPQPCELHVFVNANVDLPASWVNSNNVFFHQLSVDSVKSRLLFEHFTVKRTARELGLDFWITLGYGSPTGRSLPAASFIHDAFPITNPEWYPKANGTYLALAIKHSLRSNPLNFVSTQYVANELKSRLKADPSKLRFAPLAAAVSNLGAEIPNVNTKLPKDNYFVTVSSLEPRKNFLRLIKAFDQLVKRPGYEEKKLVLVGAKGWMYDEILKQASEAESFVVLPGFLETNELESAYAHADAFISPSLDEGFGIPLLEAMQLGVPVVASDIAVYRETALETISFFDPLSPESMVDAMLKVDHTKVEVARARAREFSWARTAREIRDQAMEYVDANK